jgi:hypothetical protein
MSPSGRCCRKRFFWQVNQNFSAPPVHAARADVRDHVGSQMKAGRRVPPRRNNRTISSRRADSSDPRG